MLPLARFLRCLAGVAIAAGALAASVARAADVPDKPIHLIVPYAPGGSADALARSLAELMRKDLNQVVIVDNKPGANTAIGAQALANSPADGSSLARRLIVRASCRYEYTPRTPLTASVATMRNSSATHSSSLY